MTPPDLLVMRAIVAAAAVLLLAGVFAAWVSTNAVKRVVALTLALTGAVLGAAALGAPGALLTAGIALGFAQMIVGVAVVVRLQEGYGSVEIPEIDAADARDDAAGPAP